MQWDSVWTNLSLVTMAASGPGVIEDAALAVRDGRIAWLGERSRLAAPGDSTRQMDGKGCWLTPGLVDCHTHLVYAGDRSREFELRLQGASYQQIAAAGGGIRATVAATRQAGEQQLLDAALRRLDRLLAEGVTAVEIKSGYGLDTETEMRMLRVVRRIAGLRPVTVRSTFLGAHAVPEEFADDTDAYVRLICEQMLPAVAEAGLADAVDAFCETIGFSLAQVAQVFEVAGDCGLPVKLHAEQLSNQHGAELASRYYALSADHLEFIDRPGVEAMAAAGTVAVLLPGAYYFLGDSRPPPVALFREYGVPMAVASDSNPGSSPVGSLLLMLNMACTLFGLTVEEALKGATIHAARALGIDARCGSLEVGKDADFVLWQVQRPAELVYAIGVNPCWQIVRGGQVVGGPGQPKYPRHTAGIEGSD